MAKTIPQLTDATTVNAADELIIQQSGITKRATAQELGQGLVSIINNANSVVNIKDFGAIGDGAADDTAAFQAACATGKTVIAIGTFKLTGEILVYGQLLGVLGASTLNLTVTGVANGLSLQSGATISGFTINRVRDLAGTSATGANGNAIAVWPSPNGSPVPNLFADINISNLRIVASGDVGNVITFLGNIKRFVIENVSVEGFFGQGLLIHWRRLGQAPFDSYHPRQGTVRNVKIEANAAPTSGATSSDTAMTLAATHDIMVSNLTTVNTRRGVVVSAGDIGGTFSDFTGSESFGRVMTNMHFENIACTNNSSSGFWIAGRSDFQSTINNHWFMTKGGVTAANVTVEAGDDSTNSLEPIHLEFANGVTIQGANAFVKAGRESVVTTASAVYLTGATACSVSGVFKFPRGVRSFSSSGCQIVNSKFEHPAPLSSVLSGAYGVDLDSASFTATVDGSVSAGATSITLPSVPCTIMAGTVFTEGGNKFYFNGAAKAGADPATIEILPAAATIANGATITIQEGTFDLELVGSSFSGYDRAIQSQGAATSAVNSITVNSCAFSYSRRDHIFLEQTKNAEISNNYFNLGNQTVGTGAADVQIRNTDAAIVKANCFNQELSTQSIFNVYVLDGVKGVVIEGNTFWQHQTDTTTHPLASGVYLNGSGASGEQDIILASNWFASTVTNPVLPAASRRSVSIGSNRVGFATAIPAGGVWRVGDRIFNISAALGQPKGWVCTVAGQPGTWVSEGNL
jgi:hypothetical protein